MFISFEDTGKMVNYIYQPLLATGAQANF